MAINPKNVVRLLQKRFDRPEYDIDSIITDDEKSLANSLENLIRESIDSKVAVEVFDSLCLNDENVYSDETVIDDDFEIDSDITENICKKAKIDVDIDNEYKRKAVEFWRSGNTKPVSFKRVQHNFKKVDNLQSLYRWEEQLKAGGTRKEKLLQISKYVLEQFKSASDKALPIHDTDLKRWALQAREEIDLSRDSFSASAKWIFNFKVNHGIVSRKINKFITKKQVATADKVLQESKEFVSKIRNELLLIGESNIYNSDQSGFNLETHAGRTLSYKGSLKVECLAQSLNSLTHSYTMQPIISADGQLKSPLLIVLQEPNGKFGPIVEKSLYRAENIVAVASKSGKMTSDLVIKWFKECFLPNTGEKSVLLLDSWTGQTEKKFEAIDKANKVVNVRTIPAGTTGLIQPLDVYTFRPWKNFLRQFSDLVLLYNYDVNLHLRNNILKIQSLIHNQFSSPRFRNLFKYAWFKSGYIQEMPEKCEKPSDFCLKNCEPCCNVCTKIAIVKCAWCTQSLCIQHFFAITDANLPHYCTTLK